MNVDRARSLLSAERNRLEEVKQAAGRLSASAEPGAETAGTEMLPAEQANEAIERELDLNVLQQVDRELADLDEALGRLDAGTYGLCEVCRSPIGDGRLEAMPAARLCLEHQAKARR